MAGHSKWSEIRRPTSPERQARIDAGADAMRDAMALAELRASRGVTQVQLAGVLDVNQSSVSGIERRQDVYLSSLTDYVEGLGGKLKLSAVFPDGETVIRMGRNPAPRA
jgi:DNA-binding XRE family transcriptional regulator